MVGRRQERRVLGEIAHVQLGSVRRGWTRRHRGAIGRTRLLRGGGGLRRALCASREAVSILQLVPHLLFRLHMSFLLGLDLLEAHLLGLLSLLLLLLVLLVLVILILVIRAVEAWVGVILLEEGSVVLLVRVEAVHVVLVVMVMAMSLRLGLLPEAHLLGRALMGPPMVAVMVAMADLHLPKAHGVLELPGIEQSLFVRSSRGNLQLVLLLSFLIVVLIRHGFQVGI
mmetsp:Transcript_43580/g.92729  ORF Transcript_43580/g.92729 Transcript_43580/m.92729 type:complete len:227 (-) Transcript_43580:17-697(-)